MFEQQIQEVVLLMVYAGVTVISLIACCYLLFRQGNAFAADIKSPVRLRRWTAAFFAAMTLGHVWYLPTYFLSSSDDVKLCNHIGALLDCMMTFPLAIVILFCMLQDRKRSLWPVAVMLAPLIAGMAWGVFSRSEALMPMLRVYFLLLTICLIIYMVRATRQYGRWLRDNYADLEHKEVWQSFVVLAVVFVVSNFYVGGIGLPGYEYVLQISDCVLICYLLWRVETLSELTPEPSPKEGGEDSSSADNSTKETNNSPFLGRRVGSEVLSNIGALLQQHCIETQLYLQHDLNLLQLSKAIGTNRFYLSQYFSSQDTTYNAYINNLRIDHFVTLYRDAVAAQRSVTAQQLAQESGFCNYRTFSNAFKCKMGQSVTSWIKGQERPKVE